MLVNLYVVRAVLDILGVQDYGIFNVVGGLVMMFSFLNGTLATASQRFFSIELAKGDLKRLNDCFSLNITVFLMATAIIVFILETLGLWFLNTQMTIPDSRLFAANVVFQFSIIAFVFQMFSVPYNALVIAYEKMSAFAYIGIFEALFKLVIVVLLIHLSYDKLILYGELTSLSAIGVTLSYYLYCKRKLQGCDFYFYWNGQEAKRLVSFTGWHFCGTIAGVIQGQGINILINMFFNPAINAARAVAFQVSNAINQLNNNFFVAVKPQMYKCYASDEITELNLLILRSTVVCFFLTSVVSIPFIVNVDLILSLWLKAVPQKACLFTCLVLISGILESTNGSIICPVLATGNIKRFYIWTSLVYVLNLPVSYLFLKAGCNPEITMVIASFLAFVSIFLRAFLLKKVLDFDFRKYCMIVIKLISVSLLVFISLYYIAKLCDNHFVALLLTCVFSIVIHLLLIYVFVLGKADRRLIIEYIKRK